MLKRVVYVIYIKSCTLDVLSDISNWHDQIYYINDIDLDRLTDENIDLTLRDLINEYVKTFCFTRPEKSLFYGRRWNVLC